MTLLHRVNRLWANTRQAPILPGWLDIAESTNGLVFVRWMATLPDNVNPQHKPSVQVGRLWPITEQMTENQIVNTFLFAMLAFVEHEVREGFTFNGEHRYMPHH